jgi:Phage integrase family
VLFILVGFSGLLRLIRFHDLRHTFVSLLIEKGAHPKYIQEQGGHSSIQVTMDTYGHLFPSRDSGWTDKLDDEPTDRENAPQANPEAKREEQVSYKLRENLVAVNRFSLSKAPTITVPLHIEQGRSRVTIRHAGTVAH